jgi:polyphosphate kinase
MNVPQPESSIPNQPAASSPAAVNLDDPSLYINRDISWLEFNKRVLEEAQDNLTPILEKLKFASIFSSNLDEFFMIRVGGLAQALNANINDRDPSGKTVREQLDMIAEKSRVLVAEQYQCLTKEILPQLHQAGIFIENLNELDKAEVERLDEYFKEQVFPILTPLAVDAGHPFPFLANLRINLMVIFEEISKGDTPRAYAFVEVPAVLPRLVPVNTRSKGYHFVLLEELIRRNIQMLFPRMEIKQTVAFRLTRNRDYDLHADQVVDLLASIENELRELSHQIGIRLEIETNAPRKVVNTLTKELGIEEKFTYEINGPLNICELLPLYDLPVEAVYKDQPFNPRIPQRFADPKKDIFTTIREGDVLLHHPYDSFGVVMDFLNAAADDPDVLAIKQTLYRIGKNSPVIGALCRAAEKGKQVTAVVELKARFDEEYNIDWSHQMKRSGVNAVFGFVRWKTHCKATLVVRREGKGLRRYVHVSSGNYNISTARQYTDIGLLTCDNDFGSDVSALFNILTGFNSWSNANFTDKTVASMFHKFMISPVTTRETMLRLIEREIQKSTSKARAISSPN